MRPKNYNKIYSIYKILSEIRNFDHLIAQWHPIKNGTANFSDFTPGSSHVAWWICNKSACGCPHEWQSTINNRTKKNPTGCPYCSIPASKICYHNSLACLFPDLMDQWDYDKNTGIDPNTTAATSSKMVSWKCPNTCSIDCKHEWDSIINGRANSDYGCPFCNHYGNVICCYRKSFKHLFPELVKQWHPTRNKGINPSKLKSRSNIIIHWLCTEAICGCPHEWSAALSARTADINPTGCPFCCPNPLQICIHSSLEYKYPELAKEWDIHKNGKLKPSQISPGSNKQISWKCGNNPTHKWKTRVYNRTNADNPTGCPNCPNKTEAELLAWLIEQFPDYTIKSQKKYSWCRGKKKSYLRYDFYIIELNTLVELDGPQHFEDTSNWGSFEETRKRDIYKMKLALDHDIPVIRITQIMFKNKKDDMTDILLPHILNNKEIRCVFICEDDEYDNHIDMLTEELENDNQIVEVTILD
ncbi:MAG: hypothetical protein Barrevirus38_2 [Barrevirus sp.]|uniref:Treble clef zinc finger domain-containing protein n=1 Tax=Barrevirus sp. TaxID=2487763 RepID=A0A3G4ZTL2_9VIRU|nr:MAG: hypothetical protein Barrevirus38_2 [Barrevirus sp.]